MSDGSGSLGSLAATWLGRVLGGALVVALSGGISWLESRGDTAKVEALEVAAGLGHDETASAVSACLEELDELADRGDHLDRELRRLERELAETSSAVGVLISLAQRSYGRESVEDRLDAIVAPPPLPPPPEPRERTIRKAPASFDTYQKAAQSQIKETLDGKD